MAMPDLTYVLRKNFADQFIWEIGSSKPETAEHRSPKSIDKYQIPSVGDWFAWCGDTFKVEGIEVSEWSTLIADPGIQLAIKASLVQQGVSEETY